MDIFKASSLYLKLAQQTIQDPTAFFRTFLYDQNLFYDDGRSGPNQAFANNVWMPALENAEVYSGYDVNLIIPAGTLQAKFTGTPANLITYLNQNLAAQITKALQSGSGKQVRQSEYIIQPPTNDVIIPYMAAQ